LQEKWRSRPGDAVYAGAYTVVGPVGWVLDVLAGPDLFRNLSE
jgi:hypothetical protein